MNWTERMFAALRARHMTLCRPGTTLFDGARYFRIENYLVSRRWRKAEL